METARTKLEELRRTCETQMTADQEQTDTVAALANSLYSLRSKSEQSAQNQVKVVKLKAQLRELEDKLLKALAVKTRKEAKKMAIMDSLSETKVKVAELHKIVQDQAARKDEYAGILSQQSKALVESKEMIKLDFMHREEREEAFSWYNRVLGLRIDGGHGVKFTFTNINKKCPTKEYSFTIRHSNDIYTLLDCNPHLNDTEVLVNELNKSNGLFEFVRIMKGRFQASASASASGSLSDYVHLVQDTASISLSAPVSSVSAAVTSESPLPLREANGKFKKQKHSKGLKSPVSASPVRRSPRFMVNKQ